MHPRTQLARGVNSLASARPENMAYVSVGHSPAKRLLPPPRAPERAFPGQCDVEPPVHSRQSMYDTFHVVCTQSSPPSSPLSTPRLSDHGHSNSGFAPAHIAPSQRVGVPF